MVTDVVNVIGSYRDSFALYVEVWVSSDGGDAICVFDKQFVSTFTLLEQSDREYEPSVVRQRFMYNLYFNLDRCL